jgi:CHRD domain
MSTPSNRFRSLAPLAAVLAVIATGVALSAATAGARTNVNAVAYRLTATLTPGQVVPAISAPASASGHFHGILFRSGVGAAKVAALAGCKVVVAPRRSGLPTRINCGGSVAVMPAAGQWRLIWQLSYSGLSGPATGAAVHIAPAGHAAAALTRICAPCAPVSHGSLSMSAGQAASLTTNSAYVDVSTAAHPGGEIRGQIVRSTVGFQLGR